MCFSAAVSFATSAVLIPVGLYSLRLVSPREAYWPFACVPLAFGLQQGFEGIVWSGIHAQNPDLARFGMLSFLFFSHWFWLGWSPLIAWRLEPNVMIRRLCRWFMVAGAGLGAVLYLPLLINPDWAAPIVIQGSIEYQARFLTDAIPVGLSRLIYGLVLLVPYFLSSYWDIKVWGALIALSALLSYLVFNYVFVSIWCFFAAVLSIYVIYVLVKPHPSLAKQGGSLIN